MTARRAGFTRGELLAVLFSCALLIGLTLPALAGARSGSMVSQSLANLNALAVGHFIYAADHQGRQPTWVIDDLATYGNDAGSAVMGYSYALDCPDSDWSCGHPPILLGWGRDEDDGVTGLWAYWMSSEFAYQSGPLVAPINFTPGNWYRFGSFRHANTKAFHDYISGRVYSPEFFAPADQPLYDVVAPAFEDPNEFVPELFGNTNIGWSSYCFSAAAMFHPDVMRSPDDGGWQDPFSIDHGLTSPGYAEALHPSLKTLMLEHHWVQNAPADHCNPFFEGEGFIDGCEPYYFNHSFASEPASLFYDGSTRLLPNLEVWTADQSLIDQTDYGLWSRDTPLGEDGYFLEAAYTNTHLSHHVLTTDGIKGRDTLGPIPVQPNKLSTTPTLTQRSR